MTSIASSAIGLEPGDHRRVRIPLLPSRACPRTSREVRTLLATSRRFWHRRRLQSRPFTGLRPACGTSCPSLFGRHRRRQSRLFTGLCPASRPGNPRLLPRPNQLSRTLPATRRCCPRCRRQSRLFTDLRPACGTSCLSLFDRRRRRPNQVSRKRIDRCHSGLLTRLSTGLRPATGPSHDTGWKR
jgi:hypothetical protein